MGETGNGKGTHGGGTGTPARHVVGKRHGWIQVTNFGQEGDEIGMAVGNDGRCRLPGGRKRGG